MLSALKRPFGAPNAVIYSYEVSKRFLGGGVTEILEVGCGIGIFVFRYVSSHPRVSAMGVDYSAKTIEFLSSNYGKYYKNLDLKCCDFCERGLSLRRVFDAVYSSDVLEHVIDVQCFIDNIHKHLRTGGKAVINFPNETNHGINHFNSVNDLYELFKDFKEVRVYVIKINHPLNRLWFSARNLYESVFSRSSRGARKNLYCEREEQGIDCFEDSTCFQFINNNGRLRNSLASIFAEAFLVIGPKIDVREVEDGSILNQPRVVVEAIK